MSNYLTIVIPVYNIKDYLNDCLESVKTLDFKIVLVNDGSTDGSDLICKDFAQSHPNVWLINKPNGGLSDARNAAYQYIDTEYTFFLDSDDYINAKSLKLAIDFAVKNNLDWVQCGYVYKYDTYSLLNDKYHVETMISRQDAIHELVSDSYIKNFAWGKIYRTSTVKRFLFPKGKFFEDVLWQFKVISNSDRIGIFPDVVTYYRQRMDGISGKFSTRNFDLLEGLNARLSLISKKYPGFKPLAAFKLWLLCNQYIVLAKAESNNDLTQKLIEFNHSLISGYGDKIRQEIDEQSFLKRLQYHAIMGDKWYRSILCMANRIFDRFSSAKVYKVLQG